MFSGLDVGLLNGPKSAQDVPKRAHTDPKIAEFCPRWPHTQNGTGILCFLVSILGPKMAPRAPKMFPRGPTQIPRCLSWHKTAQDGPGRSLEPLLRPSITQHAPKTHASRDSPTAGTVAELAEGNWIDPCTNTCTYDYWTYRLIHVLYIHIHIYTY